MGTELFGAVFAMEIGVGVFGKPFRMAEEGDFPADEQGHGEGQKAPGVAAPHEEEGREHHGIIPVIDAAGAAALVLEEPGLEGTEELDADDIADGIGAAEEDHDAVVEEADHMQGAKEAVEADPDEGDEDGGVVVGNDDIGFAGFDIIPLSGEPFPPQKSPRRP